MMLNRGSQNGKGGHEKLMCFTTGSLTANNKLPAYHNPVYAKDIFYMV
jgi:hypothetical protein